MENEGVIKYQLAFKQRRIDVADKQLVELNTARRLMLAKNLIGQDETRYDAYGFGNISVRCIEHNEAFWISGTQTGHLSTLTDRDICLVIQSYPERNTIVAQGLVAPSSESLTHSVLYQLSQRFNAVIHVHSPDIWQNTKRLNLPATPSSVLYGTPEMAQSVKQLATKNMDTHWPLVFSMNGHQDGVIAAGASLSECSKALIQLLAKAKSFPNEHTNNVDLK